MALLAAVVGAINPQSTDSARQALGSAIGRALQGNASEAVALLETLPASHLSPSDQDVRACMIERFRSAPERAAGGPLGGVTDRALQLYRFYWRSSLLQPDTRREHETRLMADLRRLLGLPVDAGSNTIEEALRQSASADGHRILMGRTPPLLEFIVWDSETSEVRQVPLPEGPYSVEVRFLDDFASLGWSAYATCDRSFTGGWVQSDAIYAVLPGWKDLAAENFNISFLVHETQHFADRERFADLASWELEYRAKLAELALADATLPRILSAFVSNQGADPAVPHAYANRLVLSWLMVELGAADPDALAHMSRDRIRGAAKALLMRDSASRTAARHEPDTIQSSSPRGSTPGSTSCKPSHLGFTR